MTLFGEQDIFHLIIFLFNNLSNTCFHKLKFLISLNPQLVHLQYVFTKKSRMITQHQSQQFEPKQQEHIELKKKQAMITNDNKPANNNKPPQTPHKLLQTTSKWSQTNCEQSQTTTNDHKSPANNNNKKNLKFFQIPII